MKNLWLVLIVVLALAGCSDVGKTEEIIGGWSAALSGHLTGGGVDGNYAYPVSLDQIDPQLTVGLSTVDAWGNELFYRLLTGDIYNLISAGPDGEFGNDDDIVMQNGLFYEPAKVYGPAPLNR